MTNSWFVIVNPLSGNGDGNKYWKEIKQLLNAKNINYSFAFTKFSKHEIELVQNAIKKGFRNIISVGGDGTLHHVVNAIMMQTYTKTSDITIGVIPLGTGNDWIKTYNIPKNIKKAIKIIQQKKTILQDIGIIKKENKVVSYFNNVAGIGYDGYIVNKMNTIKKLGSIGYLLAGLAGLLFYKKAVFKINFNDKKLEENCLMTLVGICKFSGGGMMFTNNVNTNDGLFDITVAKNLTIFDLILNIRKLYNGNIVHHKKVDLYKTKEITITPKNSAPFIQADGEIIGTGKVTFNIIKKAINFIVN
ncbi:diacylglycerol kinase family protein [uncultured Polaribacter sp.]|uniref:diacylglycerol/lipid kinase family protein n=1 Tax=uncultured Polaribacter sp. TaxID=174711 RepID=UPI00262C5CBD|nr:diacylglycerol kinase family protein [uncultured Polaribacter sp.]